MIPTAGTESSDPSRPPPRKAAERREPACEAVQVPPGRLRFEGLLSTRHQFYVATGTESTWKVTCHK